MPKGDAPTVAAEVPKTVEEFRERLIALNGQLPRRLQQCADHIATHLDRVALSTVAQIAQGAGVPPSAVMRFCQIMGFSGFAEMQRLFRQALSGAAPDYATRLANLKAGGAGHPATLVAEFVEAGRQSMEALTRNLNETALNQSVETLAAA
jgi:DNA-binding MurR/RpiR family transcriptional regulator